MPRPSAGSRTRPVAATPKAVATLRDGDPVMARLIDEHHELVRADLKEERAGDAYGALLRSIVGQQLSTKAAATIYGRMLELFGGHAPTPRQLLDVDPDSVRAAGLSRPRSHICASSPSTSKRAASTSSTCPSCPTRR